jgi:hypothetical protein
MWMCGDILYSPKKLSAIPYTISNFPLFVKQIGGWHLWASNFPTIKISLLKKIPMDVNEVTFILKELAIRIFFLTDM